jgi:regulator of sigma E protease
MTTSDILLFTLSAGWIRFLQFFVALSLLIIIHEYGHYKAARMTGTRVERFYLFFDFLFPLNNVLNFSLWKKKVGDTEFGVGWFPFGGYVSIAGMVDERTDESQLASEPKPDEFRSKNPYQRFIIMFGGIFMNIVLAIVVYTFIFKVWGEKRIPLSALKYGLSFTQDMRDAGFKNGDVIVKVGDKKHTDYAESITDFALSVPKQVTVLRDGKEEQITIPGSLITKGMKKKKFASIRFPYFVDSIAPTAKIISGDLKKGDQIIGFDGTPTPCFSDFSNAKEAYLKPLEDSTKSTDQEKVYAKENFSPRTITLIRNQKDTLVVSAALDSLGNFNIYPNGNLDSFIKREHIHYGLGGAFVRACTNSWETVAGNAKGLFALFTKKEIKAKDSLGGFGTFTKLFPDVFDWQTFLNLLAMISLILAFMNFLPIPGFDGGYIMFLLFEMITGKRVPDKVVEKANGIGLLLALGLMLYANGLDVLRAMGKA